MSNINFELKVQDEDFRKIGFWKFDKKNLPRILRALNNKHSLGIKIIEQKPRDDDLDWAR